MKVLLLYPVGLVSGLQAHGLNLKVSCCEECLFIHSPLLMVPLIGFQQHLNTASTTAYVLLHAILLRWHEAQHLQPGHASPLEWMCAAGASGIGTMWLHAWAAPASGARVSSRPRLPGI